MAGVIEWNPAIQIHADQDIPLRMIEEREFEDIRAANQVRRVGSRSFSGGLRIGRLRALLSQELAVGTTGKEER
jgi:hypothetical protein